MGRARVRGEPGDKMQPGREGLWTFCPEATAAATQPGPRPVWWRLVGQVALEGRSSTDGGGCRSRGWAPAAAGRPGAGPSRPDVHPCAVWAWRGPPVPRGASCPLHLHAPLSMAMSVRGCSCDQPDPKGGVTRRRLGGC